MKYIKKYGLYFILGVVVIGLLSVGFLAERNRIMMEAPTEISYEPETTTIPVTSENVQAITQKVMEPQSTKAPVAEPEPVAAVAADAGPLVFSLPAAGEVVTPFSETKMMYSATMNDFRTHSGIDFALDEGAEIYAAAYGTVSNVKNDNFLGICVTIDHGGGLESVYCSLKESLVESGQQVERGTIIGTAGNSAATETAMGTHLHFEARLNGTLVDPDELFR